MVIFYALMCHTFGMLVQLRLVIDVAGDMNAQLWRCDVALGPTSLRKRLHWHSILAVLLSFQTIVHWLKHLCLGCCAIVIGPSVVWLF